MTVNYLILSFKFYVNFIVEKLKSKSIIFNSMYIDL